MKYNKVILGGLAAMVGGYVALIGSNVYVYFHESNLHKPVKNENPVSIKETNKMVLIEDNLNNLPTRVQIPSIIPECLTYKISPNDPEFRTNILRGVSNYLSPISKVSYKNAHIRLPIDLNFGDAAFSDIIATYTGKVSDWKFSVDGHDIIYVNHDEDDGKKSTGYLSFFGPKLNENWDYLIQSKDTNGLNNYMKTVPQKRMNVDTATGLLSSALSSIPQNDRKYFSPLVRFRTWGAYHPNLFSGEIIEDTSQYRANTRANPSIELDINGESPNQAVLMRFGLTLSKPGRKTYSTK